MQIDEIYKSHPTKKIVLVIFDDRVTNIGKFF